ncbi:hypothetical protein [Streptosporangium sp. CA-115845]|uniref:hypothetical protein n=1 Tax=Streptosporangium sp. CA-115845 TaxID=3240071 RepID=UPI003D8D7345
MLSPRAEFTALSCRIREVRGDELVAVEHGGQAALVLVERTDPSLGPATRAVVLAA